MTTSPRIAATRKSELALAQCRAWLALFTQRTGVATEELHVVTTGDKIQDRPLNQVGGKGLFIKEIEAALLAGQAHIAVHSLKDVPAELAEGCVIACTSAREDPRDVLITSDGGGLADLPRGAKVGTSSLRRQLQLQRKRPDLQFVPVRGNVGTRMSRVTDGTVDAVVLAYAGLRRLGQGSAVSEVLEPEVCLPAIGQGALAIEVRADDEETRRLVALLNDTDCAVTTAAERGVLIAVEGNCQMPIAGYAVRDGEKLRLRAMLADPDGSNYRTADQTFAWPRSEADALQIGLDLGKGLRHAR